MLVSFLKGVLDIIYVPCTIVTFKHSKQVLLLKKVIDDCSGRVCKEVNALFLSYR